MHGSLFLPGMGVLAGPIRNVPNASNLPAASGLVGGSDCGLGLGEGIQKLDYLPEAHNDFIYAVIAEELGLVGALAVIALFLILVLRMLRLARRSMEEGNAFSAYLVYGVALLIGLQYLVNLGVNTGVLPTKGLTLPFVSYGGNSLIVSCALLGLVCRSVAESDDG